MEMLNSICHLLDHVCSFIRSDWMMLLSVLDFAIHNAVISRAVWEIECCCLCHLCIVEIELVLELSPVVLQM